MPQAVIGFAAALLFGLFTSSGQAEPAQVNTIRDIVDKLKACWKPPPAVFPSSLCLPPTGFATCYVAGQVRGWRQMSPLRPLPPACFRPSPPCSPVSVFLTPLLRPSASAAPSAPMET